jgi:hypothetical protein
MQNSYRVAPEIGQAPWGAVQSSYPFPEIKFMRLIVWKQRENQVKPRAKAALAGQLLQSYFLPFMKGVFIDFYCRGSQLQPASARALAQILSHNHVVDEDELFTIEEILSDNWLDPLDQGNRIAHAQVGDLNGKPSLAIEWTDAYKNCKRISVYMDGDPRGTTVKEIHFSAPKEAFDLAKKYFSEVLRSLQWRECQIN